METTNAIAVIEQQTEGDAPANTEGFIGPVLPAETEPSIAETLTELEAIAAGTAPVVIPDDIAAMLARLDQRNLNIAAAEHGVRVLQYERKRPPVSMVGRETRSSRPMCLGCGYGIRKETRQVEAEGGVMHPRCAQVAAGAADATKISPRYLAAIVPLTQARLIDLGQNALPAPSEEEAPDEVTEELEPSTEGSEPEVQVDHVEEAVQRNGKGKGKRRNRAS